MGLRTTTRKPRAKTGRAKRSGKRDEKSLPVVSVNALPPYRVRWHDGEKFPGGWGPNDLWTTDYWTLRKRSAELYQRNLYARGLIRRLVTNEIHTGLQLEATPEERLLGREEDSLADWSEDVENRFSLWANDAYLCDHSELRSFGALQVAQRTEALVVGDVLVVLRQDQRTKMPRVQLINGEMVQTPRESPRSGNRIVHGIELDTHGRHVAFWVTQPDGTSKRLPAVGEKSGRRIAWLVYGTDHRLDEVRGQPLLSLVLQSLKEIDRYRDSIQRKAVINSMVAMFIKKGEAKAGTRAIGNGAIRKGLSTAIDSQGEERSFSTSEHIPGLVIDELQHGEEPVPFANHGTDEKFGDFEAAILDAYSWSNGMPPEILKLGFRNNYSASQAALNEFKTELNVRRTFIGEQFCDPIYESWLLAQVLAGKVDAPGLLEAWRDPAQYDTLGAWMSCDWSGNVKPSVDPLKLANAYEKMIAIGAITRDRASRELTGQKFSKNVKKLRLENEQMAEANKPIAELEASKKPAPAPPPEKPDDEDDDPNAIDREDEENDAADARSNVLPLREVR